MALMLNRTLLQGCGGGGSGSASTMLGFGRSISKENVSLMVTMRYRSGYPKKRQTRASRKKKKAPDVIELEIDPSTENGKITAKKLQKVFHEIAVRKSAPEWLPFYPGMSYWVPPPPPLPRLGEKIHVLALANPSPMIRGEADSGSHSKSHDVTEFQSMSTARRGWPSSSYFLQADTPTNSGKEATISGKETPEKIKKTSKKIKKSEEEES